MTPTAQSHDLHAIGFAFDAQRGKLPSLTDPHRLPEPLAVNIQVRELAALVDQLSHHVLTGIAGETSAPETKRITSTYARALEPAGRAIAALGEVSNQLAFLDQTWPHRERPETKSAREAAHAVLADALIAADGALQEAAADLHATATWLLPASQRQVAALSRTTTAGVKSSPTLEAATSASSTAAAAVRSR